MSEVRVPKPPAAARFPPEVRAMTYERVATMIRANQIALEREAFHRTRARRARRMRRLRLMKWIGLGIAGLALVIVIADTIYPL